MQPLQLVKIMGEEKDGRLLWLENFSCLAKPSMSSLPSEAQYSSFYKKYHFQALSSSVSQGGIRELSTGCQLQERCCYTRRRAVLPGEVGDEAAQQEPCPLQNTTWAAQQPHVLSLNTSRWPLSRWTSQGPQLSCGNAQGRNGAAIVVDGWHVAHAGDMILAKVACKASEVHSVKLGLSTPWLQWLSVYWGAAGTWSVCNLPGSCGP